MPAGILERNGYLLLVLILRSAISRTSFSRSRGWPQAHGSKSSTGRSRPHTGHRPQQRQNGIPQSQGRLTSSRRSPHPGQRPQAGHAGSRGSMIASQPRQWMWNMERRPGGPGRMWFLKSKRPRDRHQRIGMPLYQPVAAKRTWLRAEAAANLAAVGAAQKAPLYRAGVFRDQHRHGTHDDKLHW